jgi:hypothetical protein
MQDVSRGTLGEHVKIYLRLKRNGSTWNKPRQFDSVLFHVEQSALRSSNKTSIRLAADLNTITDQHKAS